MEHELLNNLNDEQKQAVLAAEGPVLILAGAGSGKTRVLVHRIAWMIDVLDILPGSILAITFTNKAAGEMRSRVDEMIGFGSREIHVSTFHSLCARILRQEAEVLGFSRDFSIYDADDQLSLMKSIFKQKRVNSEYLREKNVLKRISSAKDELIGTKKYRELNQDRYGKEVAELYEAYQEKLKENNAMDFDDLIMKCVELFQDYPEVLERWQERFRHIMVDEYQDTNTAQFRFVSLLAERYRNICVVGDDDQSIYRFRGANIHNILDFEKVYPDALVVRLECNYRSTQNILNAAYEVVRNNHGRKEKKLWTHNEEGEKVRVRRFSNGFEEAEFICGEIASQVRRGERTYRDFAILYRTNAQSRLFEEKFLLTNIPYRIVGGLNFYARKEIKDILAYLKTVANGSDDLMVTRIINIPKRGIGGTTIGRLADYAAAGGISLLAAARDADHIPGLSAAAARKVASFTNQIDVLAAYAGELKVSELIKKVLEHTGYLEELKKEGTDEAKARIENLDELISKAVQYEENAEAPSLSGFLNEVALVADIDESGDEENRVLLMTLHSAKGLEFPCVYMAGMEEGLFPGAAAIDSNDSREEIEEERRLAYVGITRAKKRLTLTSARSRMIRGDVRSNPLSRFVREIPRELVDLGDEGPGMTGRTVMQSLKGADPQLRSAILGGAAGQRTKGGSTPAFGKSIASLETGRAGGGRSSAYKSPYQKASPAQRAAEGGKREPDYGPGDRVKHSKFGEGVVKEVKDGGNDYLVTVDFASWGTKKFYAQYAKLMKVE